MWIPMVNSCHACVVLDVTCSFSFRLNEVFYFFIFRVRSMGLYVMGGLPGSVCE